MTLDEMIEHTKRIADFCEDQMNKCDLHDPYESYVAGQNGECAEEHRQIAEWLKELKQRKEHVGQWQKHEDSHNDVYYDCSLCGCLAPCTETADSFIWKLSNYCPDCGAKMEREEEPRYHISPMNPTPAFVLKANQNHKEEKL